MLKVFPTTSECGGVRLEEPSSASRFAPAGRAPVRVRRFGGGAAALPLPAGHGACADAKPNADGRPGACADANPDACPAAGPHRPGSKNTDAGFCGRSGEPLRPLPPPPRQKGEKTRVFARMGKRGKNLGQKRKKTVDKNHLLAYNSPCRREMRDARDAKAGRGGQGSIAQLGEHLPYKQGVTGSNPVVPTKWPGSSDG